MDSNTSLFINYTNEAQFSMNFQNTNCDLFGENIFGEEDDKSFLVNWNVVKNLSWTALHLFLIYKPCEPQFSLDLHLQERQGEDGGGLYSNWNYAMDSDTDLPQFKVINHLLWEHI